MSFFEKRDALLKIASGEGSAHYQGNAQKAGPEIEKYLAPLRDILAQRKPHYKDLTVGFDWCGAFVYWCIRQAGFDMPVCPLPGSDLTVGLVKTWYDWACATGKFVEADQTPQPGDLVIFDKLLSEDVFDHIGIVLEPGPPLLLAEGNADNRTGIFERSLETVRGYVRLQS